jgi:hypothetical protein
MAEIKSNSPSVLEAERVLNGPISEAHCLISIYRDVEDYASFSSLAAFTLQRLCDAWDKLHYELVSHGYVPLERLNVETFGIQLGGLGEHPPGSEAQLSPD